MHNQELERIAELERVVGRLTMHLEIAKKASALLGSPSHAMRNRVVEERIAELVGETRSRHILDSGGSAHDGNR